MSTFFTAARFTAFALLIAAPAAAWAQTPRDLVNLVGQQTAPASTSAAPVNSSGLAGAGSAIDVARLLPASTASVSAAPSSDAVFATAFGAQDLARVSGVAPQVSQNEIVATHGAVTVAEGTHR
jgi:hypothetical protein